jgi:hypothetical protein
VFGVAAMLCAGGLHTCVFPRSSAVISCNTAILICSCASCCLTMQQAQECGPQYASPAPPPYQHPKHSKHPQHHPQHLQHPQQYAYHEQFAGVQAPACAFCVYKYGHQSLAAQSHPLEACQETRVSFPTCQLCWYTGHFEYECPPRAYLYNQHLPGILGPPYQSLEALATEQNLYADEAFTTQTHAAAHADDGAYAQAARASKADHPQAAPLGNANELYAPGEHQAEFVSVSSSSTPSATTITVADNHAQHFGAPTTQQVSLSSWSDLAERDDAAEQAISAADSTGGGGTQRRSWKQVASFHADQHASCAIAAPAGKREAAVFPMHNDARLYAHRHAQARQLQPHVYYHNTTNKRGAETAGGASPPPSKKQSDVAPMTRRPRRNRAGGGRSRNAHGRGDTVVRNALPSAMPAKSGRT